MVAQAQQQQGDTIRVEIDSPGGYAEEGLKIYDYLRGLNRHVVTVAKNQCGSIASVIFMAGDERVATCDIFIHNPFLGDVSAPVLTQDDLQDAYDYLEELKKRINAIYSQVSGVGKAGLQALMDNETAISPEQAVTLGLATATGERTQAENIAAYKPVTLTSNKVLAKAINQIKQTMKKKTLAERIKNFLNGTAKNVDFTDKEGNTFSVDVPTEREPQLPELGDAASPDGRYEMEDGVTITVADGVVAEIERPERREEEEPVDLQQRVADLEAENAHLRQLCEEAAAELENYKALEAQQSKTLNLKRGFVTKGEEKSGVAKACEERLANLKPRGGK